MLNFDKSQLSEKAVSYASIVKDLPHRLHDVRLLEAIPPPPPDFFKHSAENKQSQVQLAKIRNPSLLWGSAEHPYEAPEGTSKLLSSDYDYFNASQAKKLDTIDIEEIPDPPLQLQKTKFFARVRLVLVKLRHQVMETITGSPYIPDLPSPTLSSNYGGASQMNAIPLNKSYTHSLPLSSRVSVAGISPKRRSESTPDLTARLQMMFEDCIEDLTQEMWGVLQLAGRQQCLVDRLIHVQVSRDQEIVEAASQRVKAMDSQIADLRQQLAAAHDRMSKDRASLAIDLQKSQVQAEQMSVSVTDVQGQLLLAKAAREALLKDKSRLAQQIVEQQEESKVMMADLVERLDEARRANQALKDMLADAEEAKEQMRSRCCEQVIMLEASFVKRDLLQVALEEQKDLAEEFKTFFQREGFHSLQSFEVEMMSVGKDMLIEGELMDGDWGCAKAFLLAARQHGLAGMIKVCKSVYPPEFPKYVSRRIQLSKDDDGGGKIVLREAFVPGALPTQWVSLLMSSLGEVMSLPLLVRHIAELYAAREAEASAHRLLAAEGCPPIPRDIHSFIYRTYLARHKSPSKVETAIKSLLQSIRVLGPGNERVNTFSQFLGLRRPLLDMESLDLFVKVFRLLQAPNANLPALIETEVGAVWVHKQRWRAVIESSEMRELLGERFILFLRKASDIKTERARHKETWDCVQLDELMRAFVDMMVESIAADERRLGRQFEQANTRGDGALEVPEFRDLMTEVCGDVPDLLRLNVMMDTVDLSRKMSREAGGRPLQSANSMTGAAFAQVCRRYHLLQPKQMAASADIQRLSALSSTLTASAALLTALAGSSASGGETTEPNIRTEVDLLRKAGELLENTALSSEQLSQGWEMVQDVGVRLTTVLSQYSAAQRAAQRRLFEASEETAKLLRAAAAQKAELEAKTKFVEAQHATMKAEVYRLKATIRNQALQSYSPSKVRSGAAYPPRPPPPPRPKSKSTSAVPRKKTESVLEQVSEGEPKAQGSDGEEKPPKREKGRPKSKSASDAFNMAPYQLPRLHSEDMTGSSVRSSNTYMDPTSLDASSPLHRVPEEGEEQEGSAQYAGATLQRTLGDSFGDKSAGRSFKRRYSFTPAQLNVNFEDPGITPDQGGDLPDLALEAGQLWRDLKGLQGLVSPEVAGLVARCSFRARSLSWRLSGEDGRGLTSPVSRSGPRPLSASSGSQGPHFPVIGGFARPMSAYQHRPSQPPGLHSLSIPSGSQDPLSLMAVGVAHPVSASQHWSNQALGLHTSTLNQSSSHREQGLGFTLGYDSEHAAREAAQLLEQPARRTSVYPGDEYALTAADADMLPSTRLEREAWMQILRENAAHSQPTPSGAKPSQQSLRGLESGSIRPPPPSTQMRDGVETLTVESRTLEAAIRDQDPSAMGAALLELVITQLGGYPQILSSGALVVKGQDESWIQHLSRLYVFNSGILMHQRSAAVGLAAARDNLAQRKDALMAVAERVEAKRQEMLRYEQGLRASLSELSGAERALSKVSSAITKACTALRSKLKKSLKDHSSLSPSRPHAEANPPPPADPEPSPSFQTASSALVIPTNVQPVSLDGNATSAASPVASEVPSSQFPNSFPSSAATSPTVPMIPRLNLPFNKDLMSLRTSGSEPGTTAGSPISNENPAAITTSSGLPSVPGVPAHRDALGPVELMATASAATLSAEQTSEDIVMQSQEEVGQPSGAAQSQEPAQTSAETLALTPAQGSMNMPAEQPAQPSGQMPAQAVVHSPVQPPAQTSTPAQTSAQVPAEPAARPPAESSAPAQPSTEQQSQPSAQTPAQPSAQTVHSVPESDSLAVSKAVGKAKSQHETPSGLSLVEGVVAHLEASLPQLAEVSHLIRVLLGYCKNSCLQGEDTGLQKLNNEKEGRLIYADMAPDFVPTTLQPPTTRPTSAHHSSKAEISASPSQAVDPQQLSTEVSQAPSQEVPHPLTPMASPRDPSDSQRVAPKARAKDNYGSWLPDGDALITLSNSFMLRHGTAGSAEHQRRASPERRPLGARAVIDQVLARAVLPPAPIGIPSSIEWKMWVAPPVLTHAVYLPQIRMAMAHRERTRGERAQGGAGALGGGPLWEGGSSVPGAVAAGVGAENGHQPYSGSPMKGRGAVPIKGLAKESFEIISGIRANAQGVITEARPFSSRRF